MGKSGKNNVLSFTNDFTKEPSMTTPPMPSQAKHFLFWFLSVGFCGFVTKMDFVKKIQHFFSYWYVRYLLATELYIVETWEKVIVHILFTVLFVLVGFFNYSIVFRSIAQIRGTTNIEHVL